jgi:hypothetical protein
LTLINVDSRLWRRDARAQTPNADSDVQLNARIHRHEFWLGRSEPFERDAHRAARRDVAPKSRASDPRAASKRLIADAIKMIWRGMEGSEKLKPSAMRSSTSNQCS